MSPGAETIIITVDIAANQARLIELTKQLNENKTALQALNAANKAGTITADELAAGQVRLKQTAANLAVEQRTLVKANAQQDVANKAATGSTEQLRIQYQQSAVALSKLSQEERDNTAAGQKLQAQTKALNDEISKQEQAYGQFGRNVGNYSGAIGPLIQELVKLQEQQKTVGEGSAEYKKVEQQIGFVTKAATEAGAKAGLSYEQTQAKLREYGNAVRPVIAEVVKLEKEQEKLDESGEAYARIGFQLQGLKTKVAEVPVEARKMTGSFREAVVQTGLLGGVTETYTAIKARYTAVVAAARTATLAEAGALNILRVALIATGLGALVVVLGSVVVFLTKTAEGTKLVENVMAQVGAVVSVVIDRLGALGKAVFQVLSGEFSAAATTAKGALSGIGDELSREVRLAGDLSKARQQLDRDTANNIDTNKRLLNEVERLKNVRDNEFNTLKVRQKANEDAFAVELTREKTLADLARRRIAILKAEIDQRGGESKVSLEQLKAFKEAQNELSDIQEDAAGKQNELITARFQLNKTGADAEKANAAESEARRKKKDEDALKSFEADIAAGATREAAAAKFLDEQLAADQRELARAEKTRTDKLAADAAAYATQLGMLERNLDARRVLLESNLADGVLSQAQYEQQLAIIDEGGFAARLLLARQFNQDVSKADAERTRFHNTELNKQTAKERAAFEARRQTAVAFGEQIGMAFADTLAQTGASLESFAARALILILDVLQKQVLAQVVASTAAATVGSLATPDSILSGGATGLVRAALLTGLITAAFEVAKAGISASLTPAAFATGGYVAGPGTGTSDEIPAMLSNGESVMTASTTAQFAPLLSYLNQLGGGVAFSAPTSNAARLNDGGLTARNAGAGLFPTAAEIGAAVAAAVPTSIGVDTINQAQARRARVRQLTKLG